MNIPDRTPSTHQRFKVPGGKLYFISKGYDEATQTYQPADSWCIADNGGWLPGSFATRAAAEKAITMPYDKLVELNKLINIGLSRDIEETDLNNLTPY